MRSLVKPLKIALLPGEMCFYIEEQFKLFNICFKILKTTLIVFCDISMECCSAFWGASPVQDDLPGVMFL